MLKNKIFKRVLLVIIIVLAGFYYWQTKSNKQVGVPVQSETPITEGQTTKSYINEGWKKYTRNKDLAWSTNDWFSYHETQNDTSFSIEYPGNWKFFGSVFMDSNSKVKFAEFSPGLVITKPGQKCFDVDINNLDDGMGNPVKNTVTIISQTDVSVGEFQGKLQITKVGQDGGSIRYLYPNTYCLMKGNKAFVMSFFETELGSGDRDLFKKIISTLRFE